MSSLHLTYLPKCLVVQVAPMYQHFSLRTADVSPRSSPLRDVSRGGTSAAMSEEKRLPFAGYQHLCCMMLQESELCLIVVTISSFNQESLHLGVGAEAFLIKALIEGTDDKINNLVIDLS